MIPSILNLFAILCLGVLIVAGGQLLAWLLVGLFTKEDEDY